MRRHPVLSAGLAAWLAGLLMVAPGLPAGGAAQEPAGPVVKLAYRALEPGEPILVRLDPDGTVKSASVTFLSRTAVLRPAPNGRAALAFLGIDLAVKPGSYEMVIRIERATGETEEIRRDIEVAAKVFPFTKLRFKPEYVTPPASVQERIRREGELLAWIMSAVTPEWLGDGPFVLPHGAPSWSNFGQRRLNNEVLQSVHAGLDIRAPFGDPIRAANAGRVAMASDLYFGGKTVILDHGLGVFSSYGHLSELKVKRGEAVAKGQVVGLCGTTGRSTGPHLHWAVKIFDARVDPEAMLRLPL
jgi:murein DD-endopeptidase MepM/ murein hydrolase activator NlpD